MNDRELLELAAKAMKYEYKFDKVTGALRIKDGDRFIVWNPLKNGDDSSDLIDGMKISLSWNSWRNIWHGGFPKKDELGAVHYIAIGIDRMKVAVLVAAEIGKGMK